MSFENLKWERQFIDSKIRCKHYAKQRQFKVRADNTMIEQSLEFLERCNKLAQAIGSQAKGIENSTLRKEILADAEGMIKLNTEQVEQWKGEVQEEIAERDVNHMVKMMLAKDLRDQWEEACGSKTPLSYD